MIERELYSWIHLAINEFIRKRPANVVKPLFFLCSLKSQSKAFDRDGNGALEVSDLAGLLGVVRGIAGKPSSAGSGKSKPAGAATKGLGLEAAMRVMDQDHSGQVRSLYPHPDPSGRRKNQQRDKKKQLAHKKASWMRSARCCCCCCGTGALSHEAHKVINQVLHRLKGDILYVAVKCNNSLAFLGSGSTFVSKAASKGSQRFVCVPHPRKHREGGTNVPPPAVGLFVSEPVPEMPDDFFPCPDLAEILL